MGSPLVPIIADYYMEYTEQQAVVSAAKKSAYRYTCTHGKDGLQGLLKHLNSIHANMKFNIAVQQNKTLSF
jgi:hypothetical protein